MGWCNVAINIIKEDKFRSTGKGVNENYDMIRIVMDMPIIEWHRILRNDELFSTERKVELFKELEMRMCKKYNSNHRIDTLDTCTKLALITLCEIIDES